MEWKAWTGWSQLTGNVVDQDTIMRNIRSLPAMDALRILSMIDIAMEFTDNVGETELKLLYIVQDGRLLHPKVINDVLSRSTTLFHQHLRYALTQLVFKYAHLDVELPDSIPDVGVWETVLITILQLADCIRAQGSDLQSLKSYLIQSLQFATEENWSSQLLRTYDQYIHVAPKVTQDLDNGVAIDFDEIVQRTFGTKLRELFANELSLFAYFQHEYDARPTQDSPPTTSYIGSAILEQNPTLSRLLNQFSLSYTEFEQLIESYSFEELLWPIQHFKRTPILKLNDSVYLPLSLKYFAGRMGGGMYYSLIDNVPQKQKRQFQNYIGRIFEEWAVSELRKVYPNFDRIEIFQRHSTENQNRKLPEAISMYPEGNILWECKTKRLTASVYESGSLSKYKDDLLSGIGKGILQTYDVAQQIADGKLLNGKVLCGTCLPVIVTLEPYPLYGFLRQDVVSICRSRRPNNALVPLVISSFDFGLLCDFAITRGLNIWTTLNQWAKREALNGNLTSLHEFLISQYGKPALNDKHEILLKELTEDAKNLYGFNL